MDPDVFVNPFLGEIRLFPYAYAPGDWAACDGSVLPISANTALYMLLGVSFGGDGRTNFGLPDLREHVPSGLVQGGYFIATTGIYPARG